MGVNAKGHTDAGDEVCSPAKHACLGRDTCSREPGLVPARAKPRMALLPAAASALFPNLPPPHLS